MDRQAKNVNPLTQLSKRERLVANKSAMGLTYREIADELFIAPNTVRTHLSAIYKKLGIHNKAALIGLINKHSGGSEVTKQVASESKHTGVDLADAESSTDRPQTTESADFAGERRQLTVMFCDLAGSTALSEHYDPEDMTAIIQAFQRCCTDCITRFDGYIASSRGDDILVYFGYPNAQEDAAECAVRASLDIIAEVGRLEPQPGLKLQVRIGIATGQVVMDQTMSSGGIQGCVAVGETPNLAAQLQRLAMPNSVVIAPATRKLAGGDFEYLDFGKRRLKGFSEPMRAWQVLREQPLGSRFAAAHPTGLTPMVGRTQEFGLLVASWEQASSGDGQILLLMGEAGIGKSRLAQTLKDRVIQSGDTCIEAHCSPYHQNTAFYPLTEHLQRLLQFQKDDSGQVRLEKLQTALSHYRFPQEHFSQTGTLALLAALFSLPHPDGYGALNLSPQRQKQKTIDVLIAWLLEEAERSCVYSVWEDLQWADPSTLEFLSLFLEQVATAQILALLTFRPGFKLPWGMHSSTIQLTLSRLGHPQAREIVNKVSGGKVLPTEVVQQIVSKTDGVPLFVEELTKMVLESNLVQAVNNHYELTRPLPLLAIPATLQDSLMARLDRLGSVREIAQLGATLGREFSYELIHAVSPLAEDNLQQGLVQLVEAELLYQHGLLPQARYTFKHALIQDTAYASLLKSKRQHVHQQVAQVLEQRFAETAATQPELVAHHYTEAGLVAQAIPYWQKAGQIASECSANVEAIRHLTKGLVLLKTLPDTPERTQQELTLQSTLGPVYIGTKGWAAPETGGVYIRAQELCQQIGQAPQLFPALWGLYGYYAVRGEYATAHELAEQILDLAESQQNTGFLVQACFALGLSLFIRGEFSAARKCLERGSVAYDHQQHSAYAFLYGNNPGVSCLSFEALALWHLGYPEQALNKSLEAVTLAQQALHPFSLAFALDRAAVFHQFRRDMQAVQTRAEAGISLSNEQGFPLWVAAGSVLQGWALAEQGQIETGITRIQQGLNGYRGTGAEMFRSHFLALLAEAYGKGGRTEEGLDAVTEALGIAQATGEHFYEAELYRLKGDLLVDKWGISQPQAAQAAAYFQCAIEVAQQQNAKSLELRANVSLARLWQRQGQITEARQRLTESYGWFTEGFDMVDLQDAKALLAELV